MKLTNQAFLALLGTLIAIAGTFLPLLVTSNTETMFATDLGKIFALVGVISLLLSIVNKKEKFAWFAGFIMFMIAVLEVNIIHSNILNYMKMDSSFSSILSYSFGIYIPLIGSFLIIISGLLTTDKKVKLIAMIISAISLIIMVSLFVYISSTTKKFIQVSSSQEDQKKTYQKVAEESQLIEDKPSKSIGAIYPLNAVTVMLAKI